jgi:hypothetical protein
MKKLLLILLCLPLLFSCGDNLDKEITTEMLNDGYTGKGTNTRLDGSKYVGEFMDGKRNGHGNFSSQKTSSGIATYIGEFKDNRFHGQGTLIHAEYKYSGEWKEGKKSGKGVEDQGNGEQYVGKFKNNHKNGQGTYTWPDGRKYVGEWKENKMDGQGTFSHDYFHYVGEFKDNKFIKGESTDPLTRIRYIGEFKEYNGFPKFHGQGIEIDIVLNREYIGKFINGKYHGKGKMTYSDGTIEEGLWENGEFIGE